MKRIFLAALLCAMAFTARANGPESMTLVYDAYWSGFKVGTGKLQLNEKPGVYKFTGSGGLTGIAKQINKYWNISNGEGKIEGDKYLPDLFSTKWQPKKTPEQSIVISYNAKGEAKETANPPENRKKRPEVQQKDKQGQPDPFVAGMGARKEIREIINSGAKLPQNVRVRTFDGRRVFDVNLVIAGYENKVIDGKSARLLKVVASRTPVAGFNGKELDYWRKEDPVFDVFLDNDYIPVIAYGKASIGTASIVLVKKCIGEGCGV